ncbi:hypothetical protein [Priestia megaterium]|uniref:hypothetical protein n=1 Tax=Priestia megaterium TaxID=1404 RepID=UPI00194E6AAE|nr:hypothetical protein [Priestia megaterium]MBM6602191.1 hypothetical protein [Priestia megaterium]
MLSDKKESYPIVAGQVAFEGIPKLIYKKLHTQEKRPDACSGVFQLHLFSPRIEAFRRLE